MSVKLYACPRHLMKVREFLEKNNNVSLKRVMTQVSIELSHETSCGFGNVNVSSVSYIRGCGVDFKCDKDLSSDVREAFKDVPAILENITRVAAMEKKVVGLEAFSLFPSMLHVLHDGIKLGGCCNSFNMGLK